MKVIPGLKRELFLSLSPPTIHSKKIRSQICHLWQYIQNPAPNIQRRDCRGITPFSQWIPTSTTKAWIHHIPETGKWHWAVAPGHSPKWMYHHQSYCRSDIQHSGYIYLSTRSISPTVYSWTCCSRNTKKNYLKRVRKNDKLTVPQFLDRLKHINMLIPQFPKATPQDSLHLMISKAFFIMLCLYTGGPTSSIQV